MNCNIMSALCFIWEESKVLKKCFIFTCSKTSTLLAGARHGVHTWDLLEKQLIRGINPQLHCWLGISVKDNTSTLAAGSEDVYTSWPGRAIFTRSVSLQPTRSRRRGGIQIQLLPPYIYLNLPISTPWSPHPPSPPPRCGSTTPPGSCGLQHYWSLPECQLWTAEHNARMVNLVYTRAVTVLDFLLPRWSSNKYRGLAVNRTTPPVKFFYVVALVQMHGLLLQHVCFCALQSHSTL